METVKPLGELTGQTRRVVERLQLANGQVVPFTTLLDYMYHGHKPPPSGDDVLRQAIYRARKKLPPGAIGHHQSLGYWLTVKVELPAIDIRTPEELAHAR